MSAVRAGRVLKSRGRRPKKSVLRMMAIMTDGNKEELPKEFVEGGRTGRRNAMPDILHSDANVTTADLPERLQQLATSEIQSSSSPFSGGSSSSCDSDNVLLSFLDSECAGRRRGVGKIPCLNSTNQVTAVTSTVFPGSISDDTLERFLRSGCCQRRDAIPCINPPACYKKRNSVSTSVSESSWKYCCSQECLDQFLKSHCSKRRDGRACIKIPGPNASTSVNSIEMPNARPQVEYIRHYDLEVPRHATQVIQINEDVLTKMLNDPNNPQPGPSAGGTPPEDEKTDKQEGS